MKQIIGLVLAVSLLLAVAPAFITPVWAGNNPPGQTGGNPPKPLPPPPNLSKYGDRWQAMAGGRYDACSAAINVRKGGRP